MDREQFREFSREFRLMGPIQGHSISVSENSTSSSGVVIMLNTSTVSLAKASDGTTDTDRMARAIEDSSAFAEYTFSHVSESYAVDVYRSMHSNSLDGLRAFLIHTTR